MKTSGVTIGATQDPLLHYAELPLRSRYYPLGFSLDLESNSRHIHEAAAESWGTFERGFDYAPVRLQVIVEGCGPGAAETAYRSRGRMLSVVSDRDNHACLDLESLFGYAFVTETTAADHAWFRWFFLEGIVYAALAQRYVVPLHAACVVRGGAGVLLCGASTAGKSTLAFACARAGWTYVGDDAVMLPQDGQDRTVIGKPHQVRLRADAPRWFPELEGFAARARPNGRLSIEAPMSAFPQIRTAAQCEIGGLVLLDRSGDPRLERIAAADALHESERDAGYYGADVRERHERALARLMETAAFRLRYQCIEDGLKLLEQIVEL